MFIYGFLAGFFAGAILAIAILFIFASFRIARKNDDIEENELQRKSQNHEE